MMSCVIYYMSVHWNYPIEQAGRVKNFLFLPAPSIMLLIGKAFEFTDDSTASCILIFSYLKMVRIGMGYRFSEMKRRISTASDSDIITRLASRRVTGHELPIHDHQHYALELHLILNANTRNDGSIETCMRRRFLFPWHAHEV